ncbi:MAG: PIN domain-containing protein [Flavobacteriales bacterium]|nr:PIN domain-containing protein [Flavobacteriales bacterium]
MEKVFVDTDIVLDLLAQRQPNYLFAAHLFTLADKGKVTLSVSALTFGNLHYILAKEFTNKKARQILTRFKVLVKILSVDDKIIELALASNFSDFEDAIQYYTTIENNITTLLTRNLKDYKTAEISVRTAEDYVKTSA